MPSLLPAALLLATALPVNTPTPVRGAAGEPGLIVQPLRGQDSAAAPAPIAGSEGVAVLRFELLDERGAPMPGRLTFASADGSIGELFPNVKARPFDLAVRRNVVYSLSGRGAITVPPGSFNVVASRGLEWSIAAQEFSFQAGAEYSFTGRLAREIDTRGWISGDFHLHTLTHSGHGDSDLEERIISLVGEGVEFAVATDHNHNTDYRPTVAQLGAGARLTTVTGNEISVPAGHMNTFPLDPARPVLDPAAHDANALFQLIRQEPNEYGVTPIIQLNHPRWREIDYFTIHGLDPITGLSDSPTYSADFDTIEVLNANAGWGYYDADLEHGFTTESGIHSALQDWFNLLNHGHRYFAVGNSDSHTVHHDFAGYPRNFVRSSTDDPGKIDPAEVAAMLRQGQVFTTTGPFVEVTVDDQPSGSRVTANMGYVSLRVVVQSASWIHLDRVRVVINGAQQLQYELERSAGADGIVRWNEITTQLKLDRDAWLCVLVEGDRPLDPIVSGAPRPVLPLAVSNPVWIDADGNGIWTSPWEHALTMVLGYDDLRLLKLHGIRALTLPEEALFIIAAARYERPYAAYMAREALGKFHRQLRMAGARAAEMVADPKNLPALEKTYRTAADAYQCIALLRAMKACGATDVGARLMALIERFGAERVGRYAHELNELLPGAPIRDWSVIGYFEGDRNASPLAAEHPIETESATETARTHPGKGGVERSWTAATVRADGYVDLRAIDSDPAQHEDAVAYARTWLYAPEDMQVVAALGTDDGGRVWLNGALIHDDPARQSAAPLKHMQALDLQSGWNSLLVKVENATGGFGFYFRVLDERVRAAATKD